MSQNRSAERIYKLALWLLVILIPLIVFFLWKNNYSISAPIDDGKFGTFGDFVGGVLGSVWSLCGVLLFYNALKEQRADFQTNRTALDKQVDALKTQSEEFKLQRQEFSLQREELKQSRNVFKEQSKTLMQQRLDSIYFSLLDLYNTVVSELNNNCPSGNYFKELRTELYAQTLGNAHLINDYKTSNDIYLGVFYSKKEELTHYFRLVYRIIKTIDDSEIDDEEKFIYIKILRSQLSENELLALYYNSHSYYGENSYKLILKYNLLKHLPSISKLEVYKFLVPKNIDGKPIILDGANKKDFDAKNAFRLRFNNEIFTLIQSFIDRLEREYYADDFDKSRISVPLPLHEDILISIESSDLNEMKIEISSSRDLENIALAKFDLGRFQKYLELIFFDRFICAMYVPKEQTSGFIDVRKTSKSVVFELRSPKKLQLNKDMI
ncbi:putative phage abortive infection protein [Pseudoalteromonas sp. BDTF-M6]|uniref:putative phage abortive infection protein n=1 Tax=Pseudoalteromonas sp. BDTF-M6 TaxID=2796132 RepID=UPI001BAF4EDD|nr:putative phage abortive infection protein [Pseudoalteromonas sp. BDTF-M6]MBS3797131.1 putative phage abortive infection protein [Pseudoalteromonas sp. BDTF-M6]